MEKRLLPGARTLWPQLEALRGEERTAAVGDILGVVYTAPLVVLGLVWLVPATDVALLVREWPMLLLLLALQFALDRLRFFVLLEVAPASFSDWQASLSSVVVWSGVLLFGPSALWVGLLFLTISSALEWRSASWSRGFWNVLRNYALATGGLIVGGLLAAALYEQWGGLFPLPALAMQTAAPAFAATLVWAMVPGVFWIPLLIYFVKPWRAVGGSIWVYVKFWAAALGVPFAVDVFAILAASLYTQNGLGAYLFVLVGLLLAALLAHRLSRAVQRGQQRSRELQKLEQLGRAIVSAPADASTLPEVLSEHVSGMFPGSRLEILLFPHRTLLRQPADAPPVSDSLWKWLRTEREGRHFLPGEPLPWDSTRATHPVAVVPIIDVQSGQPIGGVCLCLPGRLPWQPANAVGLLPAIQSLAAQVASALHGARTYGQALAQERVQQELALAWRIQSSFLPRELPSVPGWQLAAALRPASETSGDFYDFFPLKNGRLGVVIADVADKGVGAAMYMALSRTLIRTYAVERAARPDLAVGSTNRRLQEDSEIGMFVTLFYGILEPTTGSLAYCNAGHNPPFLVRAQTGGMVEFLGRTGMALGVLEDSTYEQESVQLGPGDVLVLYTDGVTEAEDGTGAFFGRERLLEVVLSNEGRSARGIQDAVLSEVEKFVGGAPQSDDSTLLILIRDLGEVED